MKPDKPRAVSVVRGNCPRFFQAPICPARRGAVPPSGRPSPPARRSRAGRRRAGTPGRTGLGPRTRGGSRRGRSGCGAVARAQSPTPKGRCFLHPDSDGCRWTPSRRPGRRRGPRPARRPRRPRGRSGCRRAGDEPAQGEKAPQGPAVPEAEDHIAVAELPTPPAVPGLHHGVGPHHGVIAPGREAAGPQGLPPDPGSNPSARLPASRRATAIIAQHNVQLIGSLSRRTPVPGLDLGPSRTRGREGDAGCPDRRVRMAVCPTQTHCSNSRCLKLTWPGDRLCSVTRSSPNSASCVAATRVQGEPRRGNPICSASSSPRLHEPEDVAEVDADSLVTEICRSARKYQSRPRCGRRPGVSVAKTYISRDDLPPAGKRGQAAQKDRVVAGGDGRQGRGDGQEVLVPDRLDPGAEPDVDRLDEHPRHDPLAERPGVADVGEEEVVEVVRGPRRSSFRPATTVPGSGGWRPGWPGRGRSPRPGVRRSRSTDLGVVPPLAEVKASASAGGIRPSRIGPANSGRSRMSGSVARTSLTPGWREERPDRHPVVGRARGSVEPRAAAGSGEFRALMKSLPPMKTKTSPTSPRATWAARPVC